MLAPLWRVDLADQAAKTEANCPFRVGPWTVEPQLNRVSDGARTVQLEPRLTQVLLCLAWRRGEVVPRQVILDAAWPDVVVGEENLTGAISELRRILGDDAQSPGIIETIRKGGYRLIAPVVWSLDDPPTGRTHRRKVRAGVAISVGVAVAVVVVGLGVVARRSGRWERGESPATVHGARPFTAFVGSEVMPSISPDGTRVAFAWDGAGGFDVYVKQENTETPLRLTDSPGFDGWPQWSPDGTAISFFHHGESGSGLFEVPSIGGERRLLVPGPGVGGPHSRSPDGREIAFSGQGGLNVLELGTGTRRRLTEPPARCCSDDLPSYSPAGETLAFVRTDGAGLQDLYLVAAGGGEIRRLTTGLVRVHGFDWLPDGSGVLVSSIRNGRYALWRVDASTGALTAMPTRAEWVLAPSLARRSRRLCFPTVDLEVNVWRYRRDAGDGSRGFSGEKLVSSTRVDLEGAYSPDGKRIAFTSGRSGAVELWTCDAEGAQPVRLTDFNGLMVAGPVWSPDGRRIAFTACPAGSCEVCVVAAAGGPPRALTDTPHNTAAAGWSADGEWLYVSSDREGEWQLFRLRVEEPEEILRVTTDGGLGGVESGDGRFLYFSRPDRSGLWRLDLEVGGGPVEVLAGVPELGRPGLWDVCESGLVLVSTARGGSSLLFYPFAADRPEKLADLIEVSSPTLSVTRDCSSILIGHTERGESDLVLAEYGTE